MEGALGGERRKGADPGVTVLAACGQEKGALHMGQGPSKKNQPWRVNRLVMLESSKGPSSVPLIKEKTQKVHCVEITSPGGQASRIGCHKRVEDRFLFPLSRQSWGCWTKRLCAHFNGIHCFFQGRLLLTLVLLAHGFFPPYLWFPFLNLFQPRGGCSAQLCLTCFLDLRTTFK